MKKFKYILILLLLITTTLVIYGRIKTKPCVEQPPGLMKKVIGQGFPDLVSFSNYINQ